MRRDRVSTRKFPRDWTKFDLTKQRLCRMIFYMVEGRVEEYHTQLWDVKMNGRQTELWYRYYLFTRYILWKNSLSYLWLFLQDGCYFWVALRILRVPKLNFHVWSREYLSLCCLAVFWRMLAERKMRWRWQVQRNVKGRTRAQRKITLTVDWSKIRKTWSYIFESMKELLNRSPTRVSFS